MAQRHSSHSLAQETRSAPSLASQVGGEWQSQQQQQQQHHIKYHLTWWNHLCIYPLYLRVFTSSGSFNQYCISAGQRAT
ncbi:unnamed protein product [Closterium sp. Naga37s-1]|nr:unnamed protein product [Closterium sp. Naga37s-1]